MDDYNTIKDWLLPKLEDLQMTVSEFADELDISPKTIYRYLTDERRPSPANICKICSYLGVPFEEGRSQYSSSRVGRPSKEKLKAKVKRNIPLFGRDAARRRALVDLGLMNNGRYL